MSELVSVIIPTYHRAYEFERALKSLITQSYKFFEIVIVDDNAEIEWNQKVQEILDAFSKLNPNIPIKYIRNELNCGSARARNIGIEACSGDYVCFLDDDDLYFSKRIENQLTAMRANNADYSITDLSLYSDDDKLIEVRNRSYITDTTTESLLKFHLMHHLTGTDTMMFKREYLMKIGCFPLIDIGDEFYLMQNAIEAKGRFLYVPVCDVKAYVHTGEGGLSSGQGKIDGENVLFEYKKKYFGMLNKKSIRYIRMRHYAVLAFAYLRMKKYGDFLKNAFASFFSSPIVCTRMYLNRI